jgi:hypothetical protein
MERDAPSESSLANVSSPVSPLAWLAAGCAASDDPA